MECTGQVPDHAWCPHQIPGKQIEICNITSTKSLPLIPTVTSVRGQTVPGSWVTHASLFRRWLDIHHALYCSGFLHLLLYSRDQAFLEVLYWRRWRGKLIYYGERYHLVWLPPQQFHFCMTIRTFYREPGIQRLEEENNSTGNSVNLDSGNNLRNCIFYT